MKKSAVVPFRAGNGTGHSDLAAAVRWGLLDVAFQPIVDIHTGRVFGFEALTRNVQALGFGSPTDFFDRCFEDGHLAAVEEFILTQAFDKFVRIPDHARAVCI